MRTSEVTVEGGEVVVEMKGASKLWALRHAVRVPLSSVRGVRVTDGLDFTLGLRLGGTSVPPFIHAGRYWSRRDGWSFVNVRRRTHPLVVIDLDDTEQRYRRVVVEHPDAQAIATRIERSSV